jgi:hypothetical protein
LEKLISATQCQEWELAGRVLSKCGYDVETAVVELLQLMDLGEGRSVSGETDTGPSPATGGRREEETCPRKKVPQPSPKGHLSNKQRKAQAKAERKERRREEKGQQKSCSDAAKSAPVGSMAI